MGPSGEQVGVIKTAHALQIARDAYLDLVEVAPNSTPPVAKIMDYGKYKYEIAQKAKEAKRNQNNADLKEVRFRLKIEQHDYMTKLRKVIEFLNSGDKVKVMIQFRGREQQKPELGVRLLQRFIQDVGESGIADAGPKLDGRNMHIVFSPPKKA